METITKYFECGRNDHMRIFFMGKHGGSHPKENKERTENIAIETAKVPKELVFPVSMHIGKPAKPLVSEGDDVKIGTMLAEADGKISAPVHSSVSGKVTKIEKRMTQNGMADCIVVENDGKDTFIDSIKEQEDISDPKVILEKVVSAGIVGMGGAAFPTAVKLDPPPGSTIDTLIVNGAECEPYSTSDYRVMLEYTEEIIRGTDVVRKLFPKLRMIYIAIEDNKPDAILALKGAVKDYPDITVQTLRTMYPQGSEKNLIKNLTGREVRPGGLPAEVGTVVMNISTVRAVYRAVKLGEPLYQRVISVSGTPVKNPKNLLVRIGTPVESLLEECGGFTEEPAKILSGGPMMGKALADVGVPILKAMTAITVLNAKEAKIGEESDCIMCSECLNVCPVNLQPILISEAYKRGDVEKALGAMDCIECGNCSYICPSKIPLLENIREAKAAIKAQEQKEGK